MTVFLRNGYVGTSMDEIAALAGVSKQTVYKHFEDRERLFIELVTTTVRQASDPWHDEVLNLGDSENLEDDLVNWARRGLERALQPAPLQLRRLVIGEATRFPQVARTFHDLGPARTLRTNTAVFAQLAERGILQFDDLGLAAEQFGWLIMSAPINRALLLGEDAIPAPEVERYVRGGVRAFLAAYRKP
jgi:TetR/AcrR family transcriptional regulator, mexJK operon transcriptional repressor